MKRIFFFCFISLTALISPSCKKTPEGPVSFSCKINGVAFSTTNVTETTSIYYDFLATGTNGTTISIYLTTVSVGAYPLNIIVNEDPGMGVVYNGKHYGNGYKNSSGTITLTANTNSSITGTFTATLYNTDGSNDNVALTDGQFANLVYQ